MDLDRSVSKLAEAGNNKDGFTAASIFREAGLCNVSKIMGAYNGQTEGPSLILTDLGASTNGGEFLSLGIKDSDLFKTTTVIPLAPKFEVRPCDDGKK